MFRQTSLGRFIVKQRVIISITLCLCIAIIVVFAIRYIRGHNTIYTCEDAASAIRRGTGLDNFKVLDASGSRLTKQQIEGLQRYVINPYLRGLKPAAIWKQPTMRSGFYTVEQVYDRGDKPVRALTVSCADAPGRPVVDLMAILTSLWTPVPRKNHPPAIGAIFMNVYNGIEKDKSALIRAGVKNYCVEKGVPFTWDQAAAEELKRAQTQIPRFSNMQK